MSGWDKKFILLAHHKAGWSKDPSTKVGCVLVDPVTHTEIATGYNGFPRGVEEHPTSVRWTRPTKYDFIAHAEANAVYNAARLGHRTEGCTAYINWNVNSICSTCAQALIQAGVKRVYGTSREMPPKPDGEQLYDTYSHAREMLREAGVVVLIVPNLELPDHE